MTMTSFFFSTISSLSSSNVHFLATSPSFFIYFYLRLPGDGRGGVPLWIDDAFKWFGLRVVSCRTSLPFFNSVSPSHVLHILVLRDPPLVGPRVALAFLIVTFFFTNTFTRTLTSPAAGLSLFVRVSCPDVLASASSLLFSLQVARSVRPLLLSLYS